MRVYRLASLSRITPSYLSQQRLRLSAFSVFDFVAVTTGSTSVSRRRATPFLQEYLQAKLHPDIMVAFVDASCSYIKHD